MEKGCQAWAPAPASPHHTNTYAPSARTPILFSLPDTRVCICVYVCVCACVRMRVRVRVRVCVCVFVRVNVSGFLLVRVFVRGYA